MKISLVITNILYKSLVMKNISMQVEFYPCEIQPDKKDKEDLAISSLVVNKVSLWMHNSFKVIQRDDARKARSKMIVLNTIKEARSFEVQ